MSRLKIVIALYCTFLKPWFISAQDSSLRFEVASVRAATPDTSRQPATRSGGPGTADPGRITYSRELLDLLLAEAFEVYWDRITGPDWIRTERYDIVANVPLGTTREQAKEMLKNLLIERFQIESRFQTKTIQGFELRIAANGAKLKEAAVNPPASRPSDRSGRPIEASGDKYPVPPLPTGVHRDVRQENGRRYLRFGDTSISEFALFLSGQFSPAESYIRLPSGLSRGAPTPILDRTGMKGRYDFTFDYEGSPFFVAEALPDILRSIKNSLEKQLGLKLVDAKVLVPVLLIDHIEKTPTEN
jgi:uncharacterized protein (TIGR03435 family)